MVNANLGPGADLAVRLRRLENRMDNLMTTPWLQNASTGSGINQPGIAIDTAGVHVFDPSDNELTAMLTSDGSVTAYDTTGAPVARFGPLTESNPGNYGVEVLIDGAWSQVGSGTVTWASVGGKPSTFPPSAHTHSGADITSAVGNANHAVAADSATTATTATSASSATNATNCTNAAGSSAAYNNNVPGTSFFAVWVGNNSGNGFGKNTSSARYKANVKHHRIDPARVLKLNPVIYNRKLNGNVQEYGLIAEQVAEHVPELTQWFNGKVDNVRYDLLAVALLEVAKEQDRRIRALEAGQPVTHPSYHPPAVKANNAPRIIPKPHPYKIEEPS